MSFYTKILKNPLISTLSSHIINYPTPINLSYLWSFGSLAGMALVIQIISGVLLAMHYAADISLAFSSVEHIMRDVKGGVILRYIHANGASMFLLVVYLHMFRGLYFGSYFQPRANLWYSGIIIFLAMMATAFMGYVLPWGQMSFWGATVITNLFSAIPQIGDSIVQLLWGGFSVDNPTLNRFFSLHYFLPFIIAGLAMLHLILLHETGSNNPKGINSVFDRIPFYPYFYVKDLFAFFVFILIFSFFVIYAPNYLGHPDNYIEANPLVTPAHIVPEWYFLPFYAILRTIPDKLGGVLLMVVAILILAVLPLVDTSFFRSIYFKPLMIYFFWFFFADSLGLGWIGQEIVESPFIEMGIFVTSFYFIFFLFIIPVSGYFTNALRFYVFDTVWQCWWPVPKDYDLTATFYAHKFRERLRQDAIKLLEEFRLLEEYKKSEEFRKSVTAGDEINLFENIFGQYLLLGPNYLEQCNIRHNGKLINFHPFQGNLPYTSFDGWTFDFKLEYLYRTMRQSPEELDNWIAHISAPDRQEKIAYFVKHQMYNEYYKELNPEDWHVQVFEHFKKIDMLYDMHWIIQNNIRWKFESEFWKSSVWVDKKQLLSLGDFEVGGNLIYFQVLEFLQVLIIIFFIFFLTFFFSRTTEFTRFVNKLGFLYLIFILWNSSLDLSLSIDQPAFETNGFSILQIEKSPYVRYSFTPKEIWYIPKEKEYFHHIAEWQGENIKGFGEGQHTYVVPVLGWGDNALNLSWIFDKTMPKIESNQGMHAPANILDYKFFSQKAYSLIWHNAFNFFVGLDSFWTISFAKLFFIYSLLIISIFLFGISDRFFVANSYEIEFPIIVFFIHIGALFLFSVKNLIDFVLAIEIVTLGTYALVAYDRKNRFSNEGGVQYFILGSLPSGLLILGVVLIYSFFGTLSFANLDLLFTNISKIFSPMNDYVWENYVFPRRSSPGEYGPDLSVPKGMSHIPKPNYQNPMEYFLTGVQNPEREDHKMARFLHRVLTRAHFYTPISGIEKTQYFSSLFIFMEFLFAEAAPYTFSTLAAVFLIYFNFLFKVTAAPFHFWAPSIYGKAPIASVTFLSIFSKAMIFFVITKFSLTIFHSYSFIIFPFLIFISILSVFFGMLGAFSEKGIKRFFVYSSMGHVGFMLLGLGLSTKESLSATFHYLPVYIITSFIMWFILLHLGEEKNQLTHFSILRNKNRTLALIFSLIIFSMSGIPPLGGFFVKLDVLSALVESSHFYTNYILLFFTVASFFYYLRVVKIIFFDKNKDYITKESLSEERLWIIAFLFLVLLFYIFLIEQPILEIQTQFLLATC